MSGFEKSFEKWPLLQKAWRCGLVTHVDLALARHLLAAVDTGGEAAAAFLCHLFLAGRAGHLYVRVEDGKVAPAVDEIWVSTAMDDELLVQELRPYIYKGAKELPSFLVTDGEVENIASKPIVVWRGCYYQQNAWAAESRLVEMWARHEERSPRWEIDAMKLSRLLEEHQERAVLLEEQASAICKACKQTVTLITGGPGTGKTYTAGVLLKTLLEVLSEKQGSDIELALAAPTGKAAAQLQASIRRAIGKEVATASTLHALLGLSQGRMRSLEAPPLPYDVLVVDESSMIDLFLMETLLRAVKPGARLILLGDHWQLPPVQTGSPFADLIHYRSGFKGNEEGPALLEKCLRAELKEIVDFAAAVRVGDVEGVLESLKEEGPLQWRPLPLDHEVAIRELSSRFVGSGKEGRRLLSALRQGPWGVDTLNAAIHREIGGRIATPILLVANNRHLGLYNGEVGVIIGEEAIFEEGRRLPVPLLPSYEYGYCLSVHKSQGSECDHVLIILPPGCHVMGRELLYTAVTRARRSLELWADRETLIQMLKSPTKRLSNIALRLNGNHYDV